MKGDLTLKFLETIENIAFIADDILTIFSLPYGSSYFKIDQALNKRERVRRSLLEGLRREFKNKRAFYDLVYRLKRDGLINLDPKLNDSYNLTREGREKLLKLKLSCRNKLPAGNYEKEKTSGINIISFDIPEAERSKRSWLRNVLLSLDFEMAQKSVWVGGNKIPEPFLSDLDKLNLLSKVEIFSVAKSGTLRREKKSTSI